MISKFLLNLIKVYQHTLSFDHGPLKFLRPTGVCKFYPTCSVYATEAITRYGALRGSYMSFKRLLRCHPWSVGGYDPIKK
jgi:putative membrane protein insertion efficiency factor